MDPKCSCQSILTDNMHAYVDTDQLTNLYIIAVILSPVGENLGFVNASRSPIVCLQIPTPWTIMDTATGPIPRPHVQARPCGEVLSVQYRGLVGRARGGTGLT